MATSDTEEYREIAISTSIDCLFSNFASGFSNCVFDCIMKSVLHKMLIRPWFLVLLFIALLHQVVQKILRINIKVVDSFLDPLLLMPILLHLILWERRFLFGEGGRYTLSWKQLILILTFVSILCEFFFPNWSDRFTRDYWDVLCYTIGTLFFGLVLNKPIRDVP